MCLYLRSFAFICGSLLWHDKPENRTANERE